MPGLQRAPEFTSPLLSLDNGRAKGKQILLAMCEAAHTSPPKLMIFRPRDEGIALGTGAVPPSRQPLSHSPQVSTVRSAVIDGMKK
jgi:hypothetical protein